MEEVWQLMKDGVVKFEADTEERCLEELLRIQGQSTYHAMTYEGWSIEKMDDQELKEAEDFAKEALKDQNDYYGASRL